MTNHFYRKYIRHIMAHINLIAYFISQIHNSLSCNSSWQIKSRQVCVEPEGIWFTSKQDNNKKENDIKKVVWVIVSLTALFL